MHVRPVLSDRFLTSSPILTHQISSAASRDMRIILLSRCKVCLAGNLVASPMTADNILVERDMSTPPCKK